MKYVQVGILACLMIIGGLLFGIYRGQQSAAPANEEAVAKAPVELADSAQAAPAVLEPAAEISPNKPSPVPSRRPKRQPSDVEKAKPAERAEAPPAEPAPAAEAIEPIEPPAPINEPVIPNLPPLVDMPESIPPPQQQLVTVAEGTDVVVRLINTLSTNRNLPGDSFQATLDEPLEVDGWLVAPKGSRVEGRVIESKPAGRVRGLAELSFDLVRLTTGDGQTVDIHTAAFGQTGEKSRREDMKKVGWGAGIGAIIGAIAGGGKGAAIGAGAGAGAGAGTVLVTRGKTVVVPTETRLTFRLLEPLEVMSTKPVTL